MSYFKNYFIFWRVFLQPCIMQVIITEPKRFQWQSSQYCFVPNEWKFSRTCTILYNICMKLQQISNITCTTSHSDGQCNGNRESRHTYVYNINHEHTWNVVRTHTLIFKTVHGQTKRENFPILTHAWSVKLRWILQCSTLHAQMKRQLHNFWPCTVKNCPFFWGRAI